MTRTASKSLILAAVLLSVVLVCEDALARTRRSPSDAVQADTQTEREIAQGHARKRAAQADLNSVAPKLIRDFEQSRYYRDALEAQQQASAEYEAARATALESTHVSPEYRQLRQQLDDLKAHYGQMDPQQYAEQALQIRSAISSLEAAALAASAEASDARKQMVVAGRYVRELRNDCEVSLRSSREFRNAQAAVANAQSAIDNARAARHAAAARPSHEDHDDTTTASSESHSKYCEECGKPVSNSAQVGDTCPHCGVTWGAVRYVNQ